MSGHNKWSKIKHKKAATDAKKSKIFSKLTKMIAIESKKAEGDTNSPSLRAVMEKAKQSNMPRLNIDKAAKKGASSEAETLEEVLYEAYGPGGVAVIIEGITDNKNRSAAEIKHTLTKNGLSLATPGSAKWAFNPPANEGEEWEPKNTIPLSEKDKETLEKLIEELEENDAVGDIYTNAE